jgi:hypothetical protein
LTESFSSQAYSFIFNVIGLLLWPVGWAIGHLGTQSLFAAASKIMMVNAIKVDAAAAETAEAMQESIANGTYEPGASIDGISSLSSLGMGPLLCFVMIMGVTCIWILAVTFKAPHFIQQLVTSGGAGFSSMLSGMGVVGQVAGGVAAQATGASILARGAQAIPEKMGQAVVGGTSAVARSAAVGAGKGAAYVARSAASGIGTALAPVRGSLEASLKRYRAIQARIDAKSPK